MNKNVKKALDASIKAYAPYSKFKVGVIIMCFNDEVVEGFNIENAAYGSSMCAERVALYHAYALGKNKQDFEQMVLYVDSDVVVYPCGACLQVMSELMNDQLEIILGYRHGVIKTSLKQLLPARFTKEVLLCTNQDL